MKTLNLIVLVFLLQSCTRDFSKVKIAFVDYYTAEPVSNLKVNVTKGVNAPDIILDSLVTDAQGELYYVLEVDSRYSHFVSPNPHTKYSLFHDLTLINGGEESKTVIVKPWRYLVLHLNNTSDKYHFVDISFKTDTLGGTGNYTGVFSDTTIVFPHSVPEAQAAIKCKFYETSIGGLPAISFDTTFATTQDAQTVVTIQR